MGERPFGRVRRWLGGLRALQIPVHAAACCYFIVLSVFPTLVLMLGLLRYTALEPEALMDLAEGFLPSALLPYAWQLVSGAYENTSKLVVSVSALTALWSASRGIYGLMRGLNGVYQVEEDRGWLQTRLICAGYMVLFLLVLMLTLVLHVFGNTLAAFLRTREFSGIWLLLDLVDLRFLLLVVLQTLLFAAVFMYLPRKRSGFWESLPGALFGSLGWMGTSWAFSVYVQNFSRYANIFGSVYAMALGMLWLYVCICVVFYGGVLNRILENVGE